MEVDVVGEVEIWILTRVVFSSCACGVCSRVIKRGLVEESCLFGGERDTRGGWWPSVPSFAIVQRRAQ